MSAVLVIAAGLAFLAWVYLLVWHGGFWRMRETLPAAPLRDRWPAVLALVPARDEAATIGQTVRSVLGQDYPGSLTLIVTDDQSRDGTAEVARTAAQGLGAGQRLRVVNGSPPPPGWTGKLWALEQARRLGAADGEAPDVLWLTDADIAHAPDTLRRLVAKAEEDDRDLVSLMVRLRADGFWARLLIPPFVYFFRKLYPFAWANDPGRRLAAAAGGCVLLRAHALERAGGLAAIAGRIIDDCALAARIKAEGRAGGGRIWLGLADSSHSLRPYARLSDIRHMVARTAYAQLGFSPLLLAGTLLGMAWLYLLPPAVVLTWPWHAAGPAGLAGAAAWAIMAGTMLPMLRLYRQSVGWAPLLPLAAALYCAMTLDSARRHWQGRGGAWKGRAQAGVSRRALR